MRNNLYIQQLLYEIVILLYGRKIPYNARAEV